MLIDVQTDRQTEKENRGTLRVKNYDIPIEKSEREKRKENREMEKRTVKRMP